MNLSAASLLSDASKIPAPETNTTEPGPPLGRK